MPAGGPRPGSGRKGNYYFIDGKKFENLKEAAEAHSVSTKTIYNWCREGKKPNCRMEPKNVIRKQPEKNTLNELKQEAENAEMTPLDYMLKIMRDESEDPKRRDTAAYWLLPYLHPKATVKAGKKQERQNRAKSAGQGKFAPGKAPSKVIPFEPKN
jgi:hypothetical protein